MMDEKRLLSYNWYHQPHPGPHSAPGPASTNYRVAQRWLRPREQPANDILKVNNIWQVLAPGIRI